MTRSDQDRDAQPHETRLPYDLMEEGDDAVGDANLIIEACKASPIFRRRYDLSRCSIIGGGQFALVLKIWCNAWGKFVAVKVMYKRLTAPMLVKARQEALCAEAITGTGSEKVVRVYGPHETEGLFWIEMELIQGMNLATLVQDPRPLPFEKALAIVRAVADALEAAHRASVIHRDIKPANILLPESGQPPAKLGDFGISKIAQLSKLSRTGGVPGTPLYSAPELQEVDGRFTKATDIYALAMIAYELFTGHPPLPISEEDSEARVRAVHAKVKPSPPSEHAPDLPAELQEILTRGLSKKPDQRPATAEFVHTLERITRVESMRLGATTGIPRMRRRPTLAGWLAIAAGVVVVAGVVSRSADSAASRGRIETELAGQAPSGPRKTPLSLVGLPQPPPSFRVTFEAGEVTVTNENKGRMANLEVVLVGVNGRRHVARQNGSLNVEEGTALSPDQFVPTLPEGFVPSQLEIVAEAPDGKRTGTIYYPQP